jgi:amino acid transporter
MGAATVERLLQEIARDEVVPESYTRRSPLRFAPAAAVLVVLVVVVFALIR